MSKQLIRARKQAKRIMESLRQVEEGRVTAFKSFEDLIKAMQPKKKQMRILK